MAGDDTEYQYESPADVDHSRNTCYGYECGNLNHTSIMKVTRIVESMWIFQKAICDKMGYDLEILDMEVGPILPSIAAGRQISVQPA